MQLLTKNPACAEESAIVCLKAEIPPCFTSQESPLTAITNDFFLNRKEPGSLTGYESFVLVIFISEAIRIDEGHLPPNNCFASIARNLKFQLEKDFPCLDLQAMCSINRVSINVVGPDSADFTQLSGERKMFLAGLHQANEIFAATLRQYCSQEVMKEAKGRILVAHHELSITEGERIAEEMESLIRKVNEEDENECN